MTTKSLTHRELAWELLKQTRNPEYVSARYGFPVNVLKKALEKMPDDKSTYTRLKELHNKHSGRDGDQPDVENHHQREPGEDDDSG